MLHFAYGVFCVTSLRIYMGHFAYLWGYFVCRYIVAKYPTITPSGSALIDKDIPAFVSNAQDIIDVFTINLFALSIKITLDKLSTSNTNGTTGVVTITSLLPANMWSRQLLEQRRDNPINDFDVMVLRHLALLSGLTLTLQSSNVVDRLKVVHVFSVTTAL